MVSLWPAALLLSLCAKTLSMNHCNFLQLRTGIFTVKDWNCVQELDILTLPDYALQRKSQSNLIAYTISRCVICSLNMASPTTCCRSTSAIGLLLDKYYQCKPTEQWPIVSWVISYCWAARASTQCRAAPYKETVLPSGKRIPWPSLSHLIKCCAEVLNCFQSWDHIVTVDTGVSLQFSHPTG